MTIRIVHTRDSLAQYRAAMRRMGRDREFVRKLRTQMFKGPYFNAGGIW